jgi:hypothetical protein
MSETRSVISWATLAATGIATVVMAVWGFNALTAPIPDDPTTEVSSTTDGCADAGDKVVRRSDVTVSVYNAGKKVGRAQDTLDLLESAGFTAGAIGDAPDGSDVSKVEVRTETEDDPAAELVALAFGHSTPIVVADDDLGPGVVVFIGDKFKTRLAAGAKTQVRVPADATC